MPKILKIYFLAFFLSILLVFEQNVLAGAGENVSGFAWSENIGWVSFTLIK